MEGIQLSLQERPVHQGHKVTGHPQEQSLSEDWVITCPGPTPDGATLQGRTSCRAPVTPTQAFAAS